jgi:L-amino acid N-acyltransferase YncA
MIRFCQPSDASPIAQIYNHYVRETVITFEEQPVSTPEMAERIAEVMASLPWLVWEQGQSILGYAYAAPWHERSAYRFSVESTIYLAPDCAGRGIGTQLYQALMADLRSRKIHCALGGIALPNPASVALHEKVGFVQIGHFREVGWKLGRWVDVGYWELLL